MEKMDGGTISVFSHNTSTTYKKKCKLMRQKIKFLYAFMIELQFTCINIHD
jgi:hypothetical protein